MYSLMNSKIDLKPGKYIFMVDPVWDPSAELSEEYKDVLVDVYAPESVSLEQIDDSIGMAFLQSALKEAAKRLAPEDSWSYHLEDDPEYGRDVYRIQDVTCFDCWYGVIMTRNDSKYTLKEIVLPQLDNLEVIWPPNIEEDGTINLDLPPQSDHIIILRRTDSNCSFGLKYMTHPRSLSDEEMV